MNFERLVNIAVVAGCLLASGYLVADVPSRWSQGPTTQEEFDSIAGKAGFQILYAKDKEAYVSPLVMPVFKMTKMQGEGAIPPGFALCQVIRRTLMSDARAERILNITILRCGHYEYGVVEVVFDPPKGVVQLNLKTKGVNVQ
jgi:hypothetical protein